MPYVMMPVPEEHVEEVMQFILRAIARASITPWDAESVTKIYDEVDEGSRSLLAFVARASTDGEELVAADIARRIQLTPRETLGIVNELNATTRDENRPALVVIRSVTERLPNGRTTDKRVLQMEPDVAELIRAAEQAELAAVKNPLGEPSP
jgi:hypothetical protein